MSCGRLFHIRGPRYLIFLLATDVLTKGITYPYSYTVLHIFFQHLCNTACLSVIVLSLLTWLFSVESSPVSVCLYWGFVTVKPFGVFLRREKMETAVVAAATAKRVRIISPSSSQITSTRIQRCGQRPSALGQEEEEEEDDEEKCINHNNAIYTS